MQLYISMRNENNEKGKGDKMDYTKYNNMIDGTMVGVYEWTDKHGNKTYEATTFAQTKTFKTASAALKWFERHAPKSLLK